MSEDPVRAAPKVIDYFSLGHPLTALRTHYAVRARDAMFRAFMTAFRPEPHHKVLDLGATPDTSLPESNFFEKLYPYPSRIIAASIEDLTPLRAVFANLDYVKIDGSSLPFSDKEFDFVFSSAVIEHVGTRDQQRQFLHEALRVARGFMLTTPNRLFPVEFHTFLPFLHWLPQPLHQSLLRALQKPFWAETANLNLLTPRALRGLFPPCRELTIRSIRLFGLPSNIIAYGRT